MVVALRVDLRLLEVERLVQRGELLAQGRDLLGQQRTCCTASSRAPAAPPSLRLELLRAAQQLLDPQIARRQLALRQHGLLPRRRRAAPRARWPGRGSSRARPAAGAAPRRSWRGWCRARRPWPRARCAPAAGPRCRAAAGPAGPAAARSAPCPPSPTARRAAELALQLGHADLALAGLQRASRRACAASAPGRACMAAICSASWARAVSLSPRSAESTSRSRKACCRSALIRAMVRRSSSAASCSRPSCEVRSWTWPWRRLHRLVAALQQLAQEELGQHEHDQQEDDRQDQRRERVDEARPDVDLVPAVAPGARHRPSPRPPAARRRRWRSCAPPA